MKKQEKSKVIPIRNPRRTRRRAAIFLGVLAVLLLILAFFLVDGGRNRDDLHRFFAYGSERISMKLDTGTDAQAELKGSFVSIGADGIEVYTHDGNVRFIVTTSFYAPVLQTSRSSILAFDAGGTDLLLVDENGAVLLEQKQEGTIIDGDIAPDGAMCIVTAGDRSKSVLQVFDREQLPCFTLNSASRYLAQCTVSEGADYVCAIALGQEDGIFSSTAVIYRTNREEPVAQIPLGNQLIYDVEFWGKDRICAVGEESAVVFTPGGKLIGTVACENLVDFDLNGENFGALVLPGQNGYDLLTVGSNGRVAGTRSLGEKLCQVDLAGKYVACLTGSGLTISGKKLDTWFFTEEIGTADQVCMCEEGMAFLVGPWGAERYLP